MVGKLPRNVGEWKGLADKHRLSGKTIHGAGLCDSASKMQIEQFLMLRALYSKGEIASSFWGKRQKSGFISEHHIERSLTHLNASPSFQLYLEAIQAQPADPNSPFPDLGAFTLVRHFQLASETNEPDIRLEPTPKVEFTRVTTRPQTRIANPFTTPTKSTGTAPVAADFHETPGSAVSSPAVDELRIADLQLSPNSPANSVTGMYMLAVEDEQIVNTALISLLTTITIHDTTVKGDWSLCRQAFCVSNNSPGSDRKKIYEARVDGVLRQRGTREVKAIIEVKAALRHHEAQAIRMQETGQMVAWICSNPPRNLSQLRRDKKKTTRLLISQDRHEIYLNFATFGADYVDYITGNSFSDGPEAYLRMQEVGPYSTNHADQMLSLSFLVSAFARQECS